MKKFISLLLVLILAFALCACSNETDDDEDDDKPRRDPIVTKAVDKLEEHWREFYQESTNKDIYRNGHFEIKNTRVIKIKDTDIEYFKDIKYIVEFVLFVDYYGAAPYYNYISIDSAVIFYKDGTMQITDNNTITHYFATTADMDVSNYIESIKDYKDEYNCVKTLK